jgi:spore germination cell wall hydrolase CwlJ-like protein
MIEAALMCLALNVYFEARNDSMAGQYAVAQVVMNRVQSSKFPNDVCSVVKQSRNDGTCQFSWYCDGKSDRPREPYAWAYAQMVAADVLIGQGIEVTDITQGATHYHAHYVRPYWADKLEYTVTYGSHMFYK